VPKKKAKSPLSKTHPKLAKEADGWDPSNFTAGSNKLMKWKCKKGHIWETRIEHRTSGSNCPYCYGRLAWPGFNDLATTHPEIAKKLIGTDPTSVTYATHKKLKWKCDQNHIWEARLNVNSLSGCPYCSNLKVLKGFNDLATTNPDLARELLDVDPTKIVSGSRKKYKWKCSENHIWERSASGRSSGQGCPYCSGTRVIKGKTDLATVDPELATELVDADATQISRNSGKKFKWKCKQGHYFEAKVYSRKKDSGCPVCANKKILIGFNDLATTHKDIAMQAFGWDPRTKIAGSSKKEWWICSFEHKYQTSPYSRTYQQTGCPFCSNQKLLKGFNDLGTTHPELKKEAHGWDPSKIISSGKIKMQWKCVNGHIYMANVGDRKMGKGCPICSSHKILPGFNDLKSKFPVVALEANGWDPSKVAPASSKIKQWKCSVGHIWKTSPASRTNMKSGCPSCKTGGYDPNKSGYLYFVSHSRWEMLQIGITNFPENRIKDHLKLGWEVLEIRGPMDGHLTQEWETAILRMLKAKKADLSNANIAGKFDGYSEAWSKSKFEVKSIKEIMQLTEEFENEIKN
jgi:hypothetical protein